MQRTSPSTRSSNMPQQLTRIKGVWRCLLLTPLEMEPQTPAPRKVQNLRKPHLSNQLWPDFFLSCSTRDRSENDKGHHKTGDKIGESQTTGWDCMVLVMAGKGERGYASEFSRSEQSQITHETRTQEGHDSNQDRQCQHKTVMTESCQQPPQTQPRLEGHGMGEAAEGARELNLH